MTQFPEFMEKLASDVKKPKQKPSFGRQALGGALGYVGGAAATGLASAAAARTPAGRRYARNLVAKELKRRRRLFDKGLDARGKKLPEIIKGTEMKQILSASHKAEKALLPPKIRNALMINKQYGTTGAIAGAAGGIQSVRDRSRLNKKR